MVQTLQATYENGVLIPLESLDLEDGEVVTVSVDIGIAEDSLSVARGADVDDAKSGASPGSASSSILGMFDEIHASVPKSAWDNVPADGAINYKHYLYGWPKVARE